MRRLGLATALTFVLSLACAAGAAQAVVVDLSSVGHASVAYNPFAQNGYVGLAIERGAGAILCRKHASLGPVSITFMTYEEGSFTPADQLSGKHPMDPEFITVETVKSVKCPAP